MIYNVTFTDIDNKKHNLYFKKYIDIVIYLNSKYFHNYEVVKLETIKLVGSVSHDKYNKLPYFPDLTLKKIYKKDNITLYNNHIKAI